MRFIQSILFAACVTIPGLAAAQAPVVNPYGQFLEGDGVEIEMAYFAAKNKDGLYDVLINMRGRKAFNAGIEGKTLKYTAVHGGSGINYQRNGKNIMSVRDSGGYSSGAMEVYLDGETIAVSENRGSSKQVMPLHLLTASNDKSKD
jgi:hypothetical protein